MNLHLSSQVPTYNHQAYCLTIRKLQVLGPLLKCTGPQFPYLQNGFSNIYLLVSLKE